MKGKNNEGRGMKYKKWGQTKTEDDKGANYYSTVLLVIFNQMAQSTLKISTLIYGLVVTHHMLIFGLGSFSFSS